MNPTPVLSRPLRALAIVALCAASASAFAQSAEYRRGYDDGFRAGRAADGPGGGPGGARPGPPDRGDRISILDARYGRGRQVCDARREVQQIVDRRGETTFEVTNDLCGDPAKNQIKTLTVTYQCGGGAPVRASADETRNLRISCR